jgi:hypothetical protein
VRRRELDVAQLEAARREVVERAGQQHVAGVRAPVDHRLEHRRPRQHHRDQAGGEPALGVQLERVRHAGGVQAAVERLQARGEPHAVARLAGAGAGPHHLVEVLVVAQLPAGARPQAAAQAPAHRRAPGLVELEDGALAGRVEGQRLVRLGGVVHREVAGGVERDGLLERRRVVGTLGPHRTVRHECRVMRRMTSAMARPMSGSAISRPSETTAALAITASDT